MPDRTPSDDLTLWVAGRFPDVTISRSPSRRWTLPIWSALQRHNIEFIRRAVDELDYNAHRLDDD